MSGTSQPELVQFPLRLPRDLHALLKGHCANLGVSVNTYVTNLLKKELPAEVTITREV